MIDAAEFDYLRQAELLAREVVAHAQDENWFGYEPDSDDATPLQRAINEMARYVRHYHFEGDGCLAEERTLMRLGGAALLRPGPDDQAHYAGFCELLGVEAREEGWALWHTWDAKQRAHTLVTTCVTTTEGLPANWSRQISVYPAKPERAQIAAVVRRWVGPIVLSPDHARDLDLGGI